MKRRPENFENIARIIKEVHGIEVKYENPLQKNPGSVVKKNLEMIGIKQIY